MCIHLFCLPFHKPFSLIANEIEASKEKPERRETPADADAKQADASGDSGVVVDSATLRLSVGEKIKRLSQRLPESENPTLAGKSSSLPKNISCNSLYTSSLFKFTFVQNYDLLFFALLYSHRYLVLCISLSV